MVSVAEGIKTLIKKRGFLQQYIAKESGFSKQQMNDMLAGRKLILADYLPQIANALGVTILEIYEAGNNQTENNQSGQIGDENAEV